MLESLPTLTLLAESGERNAGCGREAGETIKKVMEQAQNARVSDESRWDADFPELQKIGAGLFPEETPSSAAGALEAMAAAHDANSPAVPFGSMGLFFVYFRSAFGTKNKELGQVKNWVRIRNRR